MTIPTSLVPGEPPIPFAARPALPSPAQWARLEQRITAIGGGVDVIVPVYRGYDETLRAIYRVLSARNHCGFRLVVIDDASPEPALVSRIAELAAAGLFLVMGNPRNLGFIATVNRGMRLDSSRDVVLLNADTEVFDGWLDRLRAAAYSGSRIGTATPLSNAATILSYPLWLQDYHGALELDPAALDRLCAATGQPPLEIPTAVGFCMYLRRDCLTQTGLFDEASFGRGYGEENDFCMRAAALGWRHVAAANTYVWHWGGRSFGVEKPQRIALAMQTLRRLHPHYEGLVQDFIARDPLVSVRALLDGARIRNSAACNRLGPAPAVAGTDSAANRGRIGLLRQSRWNTRRWRLQHDRAAPTPNLPDLELGTDPQPAIDLLRQLAVDRVRLPAGFPRRRHAALRSLAAAIGATWEEQ
jgi:GT2 family glycosyltransferase